jgi:RimJ/RimL family protein N-acetyltransferase
MDITFMPIMTERLVLRRLKDTNAENFFEYRSKPEVCKYQNWKLKSVEEIKGVIKDQTEV